MQDHRNDDGNTVPRLKIAFLISTLGTGGAERVATVLSNAWCEAGHDVSILTYQRPGERPHYNLRAGVGHYPLSVMARSRRVPARAWNLIFRLWRVRRCLIKLRPDVIVCFMTEANVVGLVAAAGLGIPVVVCERTHPGHHRVGWVASQARRRLYAYAAAIVVQTTDIAAWYRQTLGLATRVIANPVPGVENRARRTVPAGARRNMVAVGRLERLKGFGTLIAAFRTLAADFPEWDLTIHGDGLDRAAFEAEAAGLENRIRLPGVTRDTYTHLVDADIYVHPSHYEGFPNALCEALSVGCCVVATDCPGGSREILADGRYGVLVPVADADAMAEALRALMADESRRLALAEQAPRAVVDLNVPRIAGLWIDLFREVIPPK